MSDLPDEEKVERTGKKINQLTPSELKTRIHETADESNAEILQKAADTLFNEDISGALFLEMKIEDFKEMGLTFGCRTSLVKFREKFVQKPDFLSMVVTPGNSFPPPLIPNYLEPGRFLVSGGRASREEGELRSTTPEPEINGELTDQDWDCPDLPPVTETEERRNRGSSIFQKPQKNDTASSLLGLPTRDGFPGELSGPDSTDGGNKMVSNSYPTMQTDDLFAAVDNYLEMPSPNSNDGKTENQNGLEEKSDVGCVSPISTGCRSANVKSPLTQSIRVKYHSNSPIPKVRPRPSETESFELFDPKSSSNNRTQRTTLAHLRAQDKILKEGWYEKAHGHREKWKKIGWDARYGVLLDNGTLIYFVELLNGKEGIMAFKRTVDLSVLQKVTTQHAKNDWRIKIHSPTASPPTHLLRFACKQEMIKWRNLLLQVGGLVSPRKDGD